MRIVPLIVLLAATPAFATPPTTAIRDAAARYQGWGRVDERPNIAPGLCRAPLPDDYGKAAKIARSTAPAADSAHGQKLYYLWASDRFAYTSTTVTLPIGFTIVKQSFAAKPLAKKPDAGPRGWSVGGVPKPISWLEGDDGKLFETGEPLDLFVMIKTGKDAWTYGTVAPNGKVTNAGDLAQCRGCHEHASPERVFGPRLR